MVHGVWCVVYGVWCMVYGVWCMGIVWCMLCSVWWVISGGHTYDDESQAALPGVLVDDDGVGDGLELLLPLLLF